MTDTSNMDAQRIMLVEDDAVLRWLGTEILSTAGYEVVEAPDVGTALALLDEREVDGIVLDRNLPDGDGLSVVGHPAAGHARILMLTVRAAEADFLGAWERGVDGYIVKPFDPHELLIALKRVLASTDEQLNERRQREIGRARLMESLEHAIDPD